MKTCESHDWNKEKPRYAHHHQTAHKRSRANVTIRAQDHTETRTVRPLTLQVKLHLYDAFKRGKSSTGERIRDGGVQRSQPVFVVEDKDEAKRENPHHVNAQRQQEEEEVAVVPPSNAVVHPGTVMVKVLRRDEVKELFRNRNRKKRKSKIKSINSNKCPMFPSKRDSM